MVTWLGEPPFLYKGGPGIYPNLGEVYAVISGATAVSSTYRFSKNMDIMHFIFAYITAWVEQLIFSVMNITSNSCPQSIHCSS